MEEIEKGGFCHSSSSFLICHSRVQKYYLQTDVSNFLTFSLSSHSPFRCIKKLTFERIILNHFSYFSATTTQSNNFPFGRPNTTDAADLIWSPIFHWNRNLLAISFTLYQPKRSASHHLRVCERGRRSWLNFPAQLTVKQCRVVLFSISFCSPF